VATCDAIGITYKLKDKKYSSFFSTEELKGDMKQRVIRGGMITTACQAILFILGLASTVILARMLIPEHFGLIGMVTALTVLIERFQDIGLGDAVIQRNEITHKQVSTLFWINLSICIFFTILVVLSAKAVAWFYNDQRLIWITIAFSSNFVCSGLSIQHQALIRRQMRFKQQALIKIFSATFSLAVGITLAWKGYGYWALVWKELARSFLSTILAWSFCPWRPGLPVRNAGVRPLLKFGGGITGYNMLFYFTNNLDSILLGKFYGAVPVGLYSRARQLTAVPLTQLLEPMKNVSLPALSALQDDPAKYSNYYVKMLAVLTFIYMPLIVYIGIYAHPIVYIALGSQWMNAVPIFRLFAISLFASPIVTMYGMIMLSSGHVRRYFYWGLFTNLSTIIAFIVSIRWGVLGIAASWSISTAINLIFSLFFVFKGSPVSMVATLKNIYRPAIASTVMGCALLLSYAFLSSYHVALQIALSTLLGCGVYFITWLFFPGGYKNVVDFISYPLSVLKSKRAATLK
jgi:O-antigen/teichoic acid export membrane protein